MAINCKNDVDLIGVRCNVLAGYTRRVLDSNSLFLRHHDTALSAATPA